MRKSMAIVWLVSLATFAGMQVASFKPSPGPKKVSRETYTTVNYDPKGIKGSILLHQLVESADFGVFRC